MAGVLPAALAPVRAADRPDGPPAAPSQVVVAQGQGPGAEPAWNETHPARLRQTVMELQATVAREPGNLGAQLDLAIAYCLSGQADDGMRLFALLESLPALPPAIAEVIAWYRSGGCQPLPAPRPAGFVAAGAGWARNFNLAPLAESIYLPALDAQLALDESSRRRDAAFGAVEAGGSWPLSADRRWLLGGYVQALRYRGSPDHAFTGAQGSLSWRAQEGARVTEAQAALGALAVGEATRIRTATLSAARLWGVGVGWWWGGAFSATRIAYAEQQALDSRQYELRMRARWQGPVGRVTAEWGWMEDDQVNERPGGNRRGPVLQGHALWPLAGDRSLETTLRHSWLQDSAPYSPALFGSQQRAPRVTMASVALRQPLGRQLNARLEYRTTRSRDALELFRYSTQSAWVSLEWVLGDTPP